MIDNVLTPEAEDDVLVLRFRDVEQKRIFIDTLYDRLNDRWWCYEHGIDYVNPDIRETANIIYYGELPIFEWG